MERLDEIRAKVMAANENYAVCHAYGTEKQKLQATMDFAECAAAVFPGLFAENARLTARIEVLEMDKNALEESLINNEMNLDRLTGWIETMGKVVKKELLPTLPGVLCRMCAKTECNDCRNGSDWQFDERRFAGGGEE